MGVLLKDRACKDGVCRGECDLAKDSENGQTDKQHNSGYSLAYFLYALLVYV